MRRDYLAIAVILTVATGCDNVAWGGTRVQLKASPTRAELAAQVPALAGTIAATEEAALPELPDGPILLAGLRSGSQATLTVVGEVQSDALGGIPDEGTVPGFRDHFTSQLLPIGSEWVLFSQGVRVGRLVASEVGLDESYCVPRPTVTGVVELVPNAAAARRFMALPADAGSARAYETYQVHSHDYDQRVASLNLATSALPRVGAVWPPDGVLSARADIQAFQMVGAPGEAIAATFLFRDQLRVAAPGTGAYSLFVMGGEQGGAYQPSFVWYRPAETEGKGAPRYFDHLDWDGDGNEEVLLDMFGPETRWFAGLAQRSGTWVRTSEDSCGRSAPGG